ncbi:MAG: TIGR01777 family oxidoreductase [Planctomycetes bacterium]|nr:TIGR01777 family oxidoreductase [Planctomycetota bacterium]
MTTPPLERAVVSGATGFIGRRLVSALRARGARVVALARDPAGARARLGSGVDARLWDPAATVAPVEALAGAQVVFHLAGEPIADGRWTAARKERIRASRVEGTRRLVEGLGRLEPAARPGVLVSASAVGIYGDRGDEELTEASPPGEGFLADVCRAWEREALAAADHGLRVVVLRIGVVLGPGGGALARLVPLFRMGLGGRVTLGGSQWMPWVHLDDVAGLALHAAGRDDLSGPLNAVAPHPVRNRDFTRALAAALRRPALLPVPSLVLRVAVGEVASALTASQRVLPARAEAAGYRFRHPDLEGALAAVLGRGGALAPDEAAPAAAAAAASDARRPGA